jgi:NTP pyrophosphatase (non-canonical NTP hydrolase)
LALDNKASISNLKEAVARFRDERDSLKFHSPKDLSIALSIESSELEELFLWKENMSASRIKRDRRQFSRVKEEIADIFIYLLSLSNVLEIDMSEAVTEKLGQNAKKYPVNKAKGSNKKYNEL